MENTLGCSPRCADVRKPFKLSSGCSMERYLMRQRYLRSYPLIMNEKKEKAGNVAKRTMQWLKQKKRNYCSCRRLDDKGKKQAWRSSGGDNKSKPNPSSSCLEACLKSLLVCMAKAIDVRMQNPKTDGFGIMKL